MSASLEYEANKNGYYGAFGKHKMFFGTLIGASDINSHLAKSYPKRLSLRLGTRKD